MYTYLNIWLYICIYTYILFDGKACGYGTLDLQNAKLLVYLRTHCIAGCDMRYRRLKVNSDQWTTQTTQLRPTQFRPPTQTLSSQILPNSGHPNSDPSRFKTPQFRLLPTQTPGKLRPLKSSETSNSDPPNSSPSTQAP